MSGIGTILDNKYELQQYINKGGMSAVYLAVNKRLGNRWAIKEIKKSDEKFNQIYINSLIAEARLMKDLDYPAFPRIVDIIETGDCLYLVMDYIEGQTLEQVLKEQGPQDERIVAEWAIEICKALSYLHSQNPPIIYRDMKPSNIIRKPDGNLKIIDFGTARVFNSEKDNDTIALGTKGFAPPEQYSGRTDARSDIYALGMTMKYLITGINPCCDYSSHTYESKPISDYMQAVIDKCIAINPEDRYQSCIELSNDLSCTLYDYVSYSKQRKTAKAFSPISNNPENRKKTLLKHKRLLITTITIVVSIVLLGGTLFGVFTWVRQNKIQQFFRNNTNNNEFVTEISAENTSHCYSIWRESNLNSKIAFNVDPPDSNADKSAHKSTIFTESSQIDFNWEVNSKLELVITYLSDVSKPDIYIYSDSIISEDTWHISKDNKRIYIGEKEYRAASYDECNFSQEQSE